LIAHELLTSTNAEALALAGGGERGPLWVVADRQSAGRGRRGRSWVSEPGNLYASLLLTSPSESEHWPELSFVAALAVHDAVSELSARPKPQFAIKWPNDLLLGGKKFAGILLEGDGAGAVAIGIGVNCANHPADTEFPATSLLTAGSAAGLTPATVFAALSAKMLGRLAQWHGGEHFSTIRTDWLSRAAGLGQPVRVRLAEGEVTGTFETVDDIGRLVLVSADGDRTVIAAGDVIELRSAAFSAGES
jgi:BirA family biotin operon repressor/biotin-[acetyl-CoA-carboxylase] ligase